MLSSRFLVVSFLYLFYTARLVVADPRGGDQFCESVRTVTVVQTVIPNQPSPSSPSAKSPNPPTVTQPPGDVKLNNGDNNSNNGSPKSSSVSSKKGDPKPSSASNKNNNTKNGNTRTSSTVLPTATPPANTNNNGQNDGDPNTSTTLDPSVIQKIDGKAQGDGQVDSLASTNNFINYCLGKTLSNGQQNKGGSCNPTPMGDIPSVDNMPSLKFNSPRNFDTIPANTAFTISLQINNVATGTFVNAANAYFAAPQQLVNGVIKGHTHVTVQKMTSLDSTEPLDPKAFSFFKGINDPGKNGILTTPVTNGLPAGVYRISSITAAANHQEAIGPVAQRGSFNDAIYITVTDGGQNSTSDPSSPPVDSTSSTVLPTSVSSSVLSTPPDVSSTASPPVSTGNGGKNNDGKNDGSSSSEPPVPTSTGEKNNDGKNNDASSSEPPVSTSTGGKNGNKEGEPTSSTPPATPTPTEGNDKTDAKDPAVPSSAAPPDSTSNGDNGPNYKRMHRRSRLA